MNVDEHGQDFPGEDRLNLGDCYQITHGPASALERTSRGILEEVDPDTNTYTFRMEDGTRVSLVRHEIDDMRHVPEGC